MDDNLNFENLKPQNCLNRNVIPSFCQPASVGLQSTASPTTKTFPILHPVQTTYHLSPSAWPLWRRYYHLADSSVRTPPRPPDLNPSCPSYWSRAASSDAGFPVPEPSPRARYHNNESLIQSVHTTITDDDDSGSACKLLSERTATVRLRSVRRKEREAPPSAGGFSPLWKRGFRLGVMWTGWLAPPGHALAGFNWVGVGRSGVDGGVELKVLVKTIWSCVTTSKIMIWSSSRIS